MTEKKSISLRLILLLVLPLFLQMDTNSSDLNRLTSSFSNNTAIEPDNNATDAWLRLELVSWQAISSTSWDTDGTDIDVQFHICVNIQEDSDSVCIWTETWNDTLLLSNSWEYMFNLNEEVSIVNITIECWDNDESADELNNGPDHCDMNQDDIDWKLYYETNWSTITNETFTGNGSLSKESQSGDASSTWIVEIIRYPDDDEDGIANRFDECNQTPLDRKIASNGCWWLEGDIDGDGIINPEDGCHGFFGSCSLGPQYIIEGDILEGFSWFHPNGEIVQVLPNLSRSTRYSSARDYYMESGDFYEINNTRAGGVKGIGINSPDGSFSLSWGIDTHSNGAKRSYIFAAPYTNDGYSTEFILHSSHFLTLHISKAKFVQNSLMMLLDDGTISEIHIDSFHQKINGISQSIELTEVARLEGYDNAKYMSINPSQTFVMLGYTNEDDENIMVKFDVESRNLTQITIAESLANADEDDVEWLSDRHFLMNEIVLDVLTGTTQDLTLDSGNVSKGWASGYDNFYALTYELGNDTYAIMNPINENYSTTIFGCPEVSCYPPDHYLRVSPEGDRILIGNDMYPSQSVGHLDTDLDMIPDYRDICNNTPVNLVVDSDGCSEQDLDADGVTDMFDDCPNTSFGSAVNSSGCAVDDFVDLDSDGDGVRDSLDWCANTPDGVVVDDGGCKQKEQLDSEDQFTDTFCGALCCFSILFYIVLISRESESESLPVYTPLTDNELRIARSNQRKSNLSQRKRSNVQREKPSMGYVNVECIECGNFFSREKLRFIDVITMNYNQVCFNCKFRNANFSGECVDDTYDYGEGY